MGIPYLSFLVDAPNRFTLQLKEAFHVFISADDWNERLASSMHAFDLGASPGGWSYQLVKRSMPVGLADNGLMATSLMEANQVTHHHVDGFKFEPTSSKIYWLVCDIVEKSAKVTNLMIQ